MTDEELVERYRGALAGEGEAFLSQLFERHHLRVAAWCYRMTGDTDSAADLAQEVFLRAFQRLDGFRGESSFTTWLYSIMRNRWVDEVRSRAVRPGETTGMVLDQVADSREAPPAAIEREQAAGELRRMIREELDETEAKVMTLHYVEEMPLDSITRLLGLENQSGAKAYIVSARRKLDRVTRRKR